ncbi:hypothetical protein GCM10009846_17030 [Agrococcus versicolor]|uniref:M23ase beta-sheet core domain-containing protein n=1 Tax=Agrococcus versicolor TaxID=501482 RepID=A0ABP5ML50_9MICO
MTRQDESAQADADQGVPSTRRSRREGEREAQSRALYADSGQTSSAMRVVDGGSPIYRTRREMRESASRLARDLPVIVEPTLAQADAATVRPVDAESRRARRALQQPASTAADAAVETPQATTARRGRRAADGAAFVADEQPAVAGEQATRRARPAAAPQESTAPSADETGIAASVVAPEPEGSSIVVDASPTTAAASTPSSPEPTPVATAAASVAASAPAADAPQAERAMTRAERRAAQAAGSAEVSAAVAAVLGAEQADAASTPVRSPLRRETRPPRPAVVARRPVSVAPVVRPSRRARSSAARKAVQRLGAAGVILSIGSFVAVTSLPAQALSPAPEAPPAYGDVQVEQQLDVTSGSGAHGDEEVTAVLTREDFNVADEIASTRLDADELAQLQAVADTDTIGPYYEGEPSMPNVWAQLETSYTQSPFPSLAEVPVSSGFGYRWGSFHGGVDLIPGAGTPVFPIANGVVVAVWQGNNPGGGGYEVIVEHNIDGQFFQSWYPHMTAGSILVEEGQVVDITTQLGAVGSTGRSTGAHLHLEIKNGDYISVDPLVWLATREQILEP